MIQTSQQTLNGQGVPILSPNQVPGGVRKPPQMATVAIENKLFDVKKIKPPRIQVLAGSNRLEMPSSVSNRLDSSLSSGTSFQTMNDPLNTLPTSVLSSRDAGMSRVDLQSMSNITPSRENVNILNFDRTTSVDRTVNGLTNRLMNHNTAKDPVAETKVQMLENSRLPSPTATDLNVLFDSTKLSKSNNLASVLVVSPSNNPAINVDGAGFTAQGSFDVMQTGGKVPGGSLPPSNINVDVQFMKTNNTDPFGSGLTSIQTDGSFLGFPSGGTDHLSKVSPSASSNTKFHDQASLLNMISQQIAARIETPPPVFPTVSEPKFPSGRMPYTGPASAWDRKQSLPQKIDLYIPPPTLPSVPEGPRIEIGTPPPPPSSRPFRPVTSKPFTPIMPFDPIVPFNDTKLDFTGINLPNFDVPFANDKLPVTKPAPVTVPPFTLPTVAPTAMPPLIFPTDAPTVMPPLTFFGPSDKIVVPPLPDPAPTIDILAFSNVPPQIEPVQATTINSTRMDAPPTTPPTGPPTTPPPNSPPTNPLPTIFSTNVQETTTVRNIALKEVNSSNVGTTINDGSAIDAGKLEVIQYDMSPFAANGNWAIFDPTSLPPNVNFNDLGPVLDIALDPNEINFKSSQDVGISNMFGQQSTNAPIKKDKTASVKTGSGTNVSTARKTTKRKSQKTANKSQKKKDKTPTTTTTKSVDVAFQNAAASTTISPFAMDFTTTISPFAMDILPTLNDKISLSNIIPLQGGPGFLPDVGFQQIDNQLFNGPNNLAVDLPPPPPFK